VTGPALPEATRGAQAQLALLRIAALPIEALAPLAAPVALAALDAVLALAADLDAEIPRLTDALYAAAGEPPGEADPEAAHKRQARQGIIALRRALHNRRRVSAAELAAARASLPAELFAAIAHHLARRAELATREADSARAYRADLARARRALLALAGEPTFQLGIRLVSRALLARLSALAGRDPARFRHDERHALAKLAAYAARCATKTSPNSVFCATALAWIGGEAAAVSGENRPARLDLLLSVAEARKVAACLAIDRAAWPAVVPRPNPTLRRDPADPDAWLFWRPTTPRREDDMEVLSRTRAQPVLDLFLAEAARRRALPDLLAAVAERSGYDLAALTPFFVQLVDRGVLIAELEPPYNTRRSLAFLAEAMRQAGCDAPWLAEIEAVEREVEAWAGRAPEERIPALDRIAARLAALPHVRPLQGDELFRLDTASALAVALPERVRADLEVPLRRAVRLFAALYPERAFRAGWAARFLSRHPADVDVPVLDLYHGLFEPTQEERPESFPPALPGATEAAATLERTRAFFAERAREALAAGREEVTLTAADWEALVDNLPEPVWSAGALFQIAARAPEDVTAGRYRLALNALFGAGIALARFAHLHDPGPQGPVAREVARSWAPLAREGAVLAELTYTHLGRSANAGLRPMLFRHEIELLGERATPGAEVIPLSELAVRWDTAAERFVLRWLPRDLEVVPVITSGINPEGFVSFLVEIGRQGLQPLAWFPGFEVPGVSRWPRFVAGKLVLFRRRWTFAPGEAPEVPREGGDPDAAGAAFFARTVRWRRAHGLPRHVFLHTPADPKPYYADLDSPLSVDLLRRTLIPNEAGAAPPILHVVEMLPGPEEMWVADGRGRYATEFLLHLSGPAAG
jgi:lantibiotic biosynthesis dehydratase-like protein